MITPANGVMEHQEENREITPQEIIEQKLREAEIPGREVEFDPDEAERLAFREDALSDEDARDSILDL